MKGSGNLLLRSQKVTLPAASTWPNHHGVGSRAASQTARKFVKKQTCWWFGDSCFSYFKNVYFKRCLVNMNRLQGVCGCRLNLFSFLPLQPWRWTCCTGFPLCANCFEGGKKNQSAVLAMNLILIYCYNMSSECCSSCIVAHQSGTNIRTSRFQWDIFPSREPTNRLCLACANKNENI